MTEMTRSQKDGTLAEKKSDGIPDSQENDDISDEIQDSPEKYSDDVTPPFEEQDEGQMDPTTQLAGNENDDIPNSPEKDIRGDDVPDSTEKENDSDTQSSEEQSREGMCSKWGRRLGAWLGIVIVVALVVGLSVGLTVGGEPEQEIYDGMDDGPDESPPTLIPTPRRSTLAGVQAFLASRSISSSTDLEQLGTPQYDAARWLAEDDYADLPVPSANLPLDDLQVYLYVARYVMVVMFFALDGGNWERSLNFLAPTSVCDWHQQNGFYCDSNSVPRAIFIDFHDMLGMLPTEIGHLTTLQVLSIKSNPDLGGSIPSDICRMTDLKEWDMRDNNLTGSIPTCIGELSNLEALVLSYNDLDDRLPTLGFCQIQNLREINLQYNALTGELPSCLQEFENLASLIISNNLFQGPFPELGPLLSLSQLVIDDNLFSGDITIFNPLRNLRVLFAEDNRFHGDLNALGTNFPMLTGLDLSSNNISSTNGLPPQFLDFPSLALLDVSRNNIQGFFNPPAVTNAILKWLAVYDNELSGPIPTNLTNLMILEHLDLSNNNFNGPMPPSLGMVRSLEYLFLANNAFESGPIPSEYESLLDLKEFSAKQTKRSGQLPNFFADFDDLILLDLSNNDFSGAVPDAWGSMRQMQYLLLSRNTRLGGSIPSTFEDMVTLRNLFLDRTAVSGDLDVVCGLPFWQDFNNDGQVVGEIFADCLGGGTVTCTCHGCFCCYPNGDVCYPKTANLDLTWEEEFARTTHDFGISDDTREQTRYIPPTTSP